MGKGRETISWNDYRIKAGGKPKSNTKGGAPKTEPKTQHLTPATAAAGKATAPYNFVSLPDKPLASEISSVDAFKAHIESRGNISGEIELELETLTPLFIGGNGDVNFAPSGTPIIPGSTLRGMFKNIFKIVTCGTFRGRTASQRKGEDFNDEHVYYRCLMGVSALPWTKDLNKLYNDRMTSSWLGADKKMHQGKAARPGFLIRTTDNRFYLAPSISGGAVMNHDRKEDRILISEYQEKFNTFVKIRGDSHVEWRGGTAYIVTGSQPKFKLHDEKSYAGLSGEQKKKAGKQFIRYTSIDYVDWAREHWTELPDSVRESYEHDRNRRGVNLFKDSGILNRAQLQKLVKNLRDDVKSLIPCHFLIENDEITAFGHGQCFRIPYKKAIGDLVPAALQSTDVVDFSDAVFGREKFWASRVQFEDAVPAGEIHTLGKDFAHPLMQPNPTSFQLYLTQNARPPLNNWDTNGTKIRGYKMYWHCETDDWRATDAEKEPDVRKTPDKRMTKDLTPLKAGAKFTAKIRFQNLSAVELGALMMIFDLDGHGENAAYKIGKGKPLGFGSVRIKPTLFVERGDAYAELFDGSGWANPYRAESPTAYLDAFKKHLGSQTAAWKKVMEELNAILNWEKKPAPDKVKAMRSVYDGKTMLVDERFRQREILPTILEVLK